MKKFITIILASLILLLVGCNENNNEEVNLSTEHKTSSEYLPDSTKIMPETDGHKDVDSLPKYVPGDIILMAEEDKLANLPPNAKYRDVYYSGMSSLPDLYEVEEYNAWIDRTPVVEDEMRVVQYIKEYNISKEDFIKAIENSQKWLQEMGYDLREEMWELPNADIIYTFDNDIINEYYRRQ